MMYRKKIEEKKDRLRQLEEEAKVFYENFVQLNSLDKKQLMSEKKDSSRDRPDFKPDFISPASHQVIEDTLTF